MKAPTRWLLALWAASLAALLTACPGDGGASQSGLDVAGDLPADAPGELADGAPADVAEEPDDSSASDSSPGDVTIDPEPTGDPDLADVSPPDLLEEDADADPDLCPDRAPAPTSEPYVRAGHGFGEYEEVANCAEVPIVFGPQGGAHIWGAFEAGNFMAEANVFYAIEFEFVQEGEVVAEAHYSDRLRGSSDPEEGPYTYHSVTVILDDAYPPESRLDIPGVLRVRLSGEQIDLTDEVILIPNELTFF